MHPILFIFLASLTLFCSLGAASRPDFASFWQELQYRHPALKLAQAELSAAEAQAQQAERWLPGDPELQFQYGNQWIQGNPEDDNWQIQLSQNFETAGQSELRKTLSRYSIQARQWAIEEQRRQLKHQLWQIWLELGGQQALYQAQAQSLQNLVLLAEASQQRYQAGDIAYLEWDILQMSVVQAQQSQLQRQLEIQHQQEQLAHLLQTSAQDYQVGFTVRYLTDTWQPEALEKIALNLRPDLLGLQAEVQQSQMQLALTERLQIPDLRVFVGVNGSRGTLRREDFMGNPGDIQGIVDNNHSLQLGLGLPLPLTSRRPEFAQAQAEVQRYQALLTAREQQIRAEIRQAWRQYQLNQEILKTDGQLKQQMTQQLSLMNQAYQRGEIPLERFLYMQERAFQLQEKYWQHQISHQKSLVALETAVGQTLSGEPYALFF